MFKSRPQWWQLTLLVVLVLVSLFGLRYLPLSPTLHRVLQVVGVVGGYLLLLAWLRVNAGAIESEDRWQRQRPPTYQIDSVSMPETADSGQQDRQTGSGE